MGGWQRFWATAAIWGGVTATTIVLFATQAAHRPHPFSETMLLGLVVVIIAGAVGATRAVWQTVREVAARQNQAQAAKAKRSHNRRVERLIAALDDEEFYDLEALLIAHRENDTAERESQL